MTDDWYARLQASGLLDTLAPYAPVLVGAYPLGMAPPGSRIEIIPEAGHHPEQEQPAAVVEQILHFMRG